MITIGQDKKQMKNILQRDKQKGNKKKQWKKVGRVGGCRRKNTLYIFKAKKGKQCQYNGTENLSVVIKYLIEAFKMRLLSIAESFESPKRSNSTFKWLGKLLKDELMLVM